MPILFAMLSIFPIDLFLCCCFFFLQVCLLWNCYFDWYFKLCKYLFSLKWKNYTNFQNLSMNKLENMSQRIERRKLINTNKYDVTIWLKKCNAGKKTPIFSKKVDVKIPQSETHSWIIFETLIDWMVYLVLYLMVHTKLVWSYHETAPNYHTI